jgi:hypothetical protein
MHHQQPPTHTTYSHHLGREKRKHRESFTPNKKKKLAATNSESLFSATEEDATDESSGRALNPTD